MRADARFFSQSQIEGGMGIGLRIFLVNDDDSLERLAVARYERLLRRDPEECLPQYAGKRVRYALVAYEVENSCYPPV